MNDAFDYQFQGGAQQGAFFDDIGTGLGDWVEGWGADNKARADYNSAVVAEKNERTLSMRKFTDAFIKIAGLFAIVLAVVLVVKAVKGK